MIFQSISRVVRQAEDGVAIPLVDYFRLEAVSTHSEKVLGFSSLFSLP